MIFVEAEKDYNYYYNLHRKEHDILLERCKRLETINAEQRKTIQLQTQVLDEREAQIKFWSTQFSSLQSIMSEISRGKS